MKARFQERVKESIDVDAPDIWNDFKNKILKACDEACSKKKGGRNHEDNWSWNEEMKEAIRKKKVAYQKMCENLSEKNKAKYKNIKNLAKKVPVLTNFMRKEAEK